MIEVSGVVALPDEAMEREIDFYVPVTHRVRDYVSILPNPRRIVQIRPCGTMGVEFRIPSNSCEITETVVLMLSESEKCLVPGNAPVVEGVPALKVSDELFEKAGDLLIANYDAPIAVAFGNGLMDVVFGDSVSIEYIAKSGSTEYFVGDGRLAGIRFGGLSSEEIELLEECRERDRQIRL